MAFYTVLESPDGQPERVVMVREEFSLAAAIFMVFWALWHRMWIVAALLFVIILGLELATQILRLDPTLISIAGLAVSVLFGFEARGLQVMSLQRAGYVHAGVISAESSAAAELRYFAGRPLSRRPEQATSPAPPARAVLSQQHDALGLFGSP